MISKKPLGFSGFSLFSDKAMLLAMVDSHGPTSAAQFSSVKPPILPEINLPIHGHSPGKLSETKPSTASARIGRNYTTKQVLGMGLARSKPMKKITLIIYNI